MDSIEEIQDKLKVVLKKKRFLHTLGVQYTAQSLAMCYGLDVNKAGYAGVLHDCAKYLSDKEMLSEAKKYNIQITKTENKQPFLLHAKLGACYAREKYGVDDAEIFQAICWHTTGKANMTDFEKIIYIADYIEPSRKMLPHMDKIRKIAFQNLNQAMYLILHNTVSYLKDSRQQNLEPIDEHSIEAFDFYSK